MHRFIINSNIPVTGQSVSPYQLDHVRQTEVKADITQDC